MVLTFKVFIVCLIVSFIRARPSRLKILPGLAFYRTEDGQTDNENSLMDRDKDLLRSMWNIVDKMDYRNRETLPQLHSDSLAQAGDRSLDIMRKSNSNTNKVHKTPTLHGVPSTSHNVGPHGAKPPPIGTPITTINVFSSYPAAMKGDHPFPAPYSQTTSFGATPFTSSSASHSTPNLMHHNGPRFDVPKSIRNAYDQFLPTSSPFDEPGLPPQENLMSQHQFNPMLNQNSGLGQIFEHPMDNSDMGPIGFDSEMNRDEIGQGFGEGIGGRIGLDHPSDSEPMQFLMPQMESNARSMGDFMHQMPDSLRQLNNY